MSEEVKYLDGIITGYKATNGDMKCRDFQFEIGKWHECEGELELCKNGFHFCEQPSGVWAYYSGSDTRVFKIEAEFVLDNKVEPGADFKRVAKRIRLVEEIKVGSKQNTGDGNTGDWNTGYRNTGDGNTGDRNTGDGNTGDRNTGDGNTGDRNTGDGNTGDGNTGYRNTGYRNTGDRNTGDRNTGDRNTGDGNTGDRNTGDGNTGDGNTGDGNATNKSSGYFCQDEPRVVCFDLQTELTHEQFESEFPEYWDLAKELHEIYEIDFDKYKKLPGITPEKLKSLHKKHLQAKEVSKD